MSSGRRPVSPQTIWVKTVPSPWPMQEAPAWMWSFPPSTASRARPVSGMPTPTPAFFMAQARPAAFPSANAFS